MRREARDLKIITLEQKTVETIEAGSEKLLALIESKFTEKGRTVVVLVVGEPNSGKSRLAGLLKTGASIPKYSGIENATKHAGESKAVLIEEVGDIVGINHKAKGLNYEIDLVVYIYNPLATENLSQSMLDSADLVVKNYASKKKS